jgi:hypothetical protein
MYTLNNVAGEPDYVVNVLWKLTGVDGQTTASIDGNTQFEVNQEQTDFVPYLQLTEALVIQWVQEALGETGVANFEANVNGQIESQKNPPVSPQNTPLPWATPAAE